MDATVCVVGLGYVGLPTAALFAKSGMRVLGVDIDRGLIATLKSGKSTSDEPGVRTLVEECLQSGALTVSETVSEADIYIICVPTPINIRNKAEMAFVKSATQSLFPSLRKGNLVILQSTSPVGSTRVIAEIIKKSGLDPETEVDVCYCPERVFPGRSLDEMIYNSRVIGGLSDGAAERAVALYGHFCKGELVTTTAEAAEFAKLIENTYRDVNIALSNTFARIAEESNIDAWEAIRVANMHPRVNIHAPGAGVGGHCIPVDPWFIIEQHPALTQLLSQARDINDTQPKRLLERALVAGLQPGDKVAILGVAYRGDIDDARESPSELLIYALSQRGFHWTAHDPMVSIWRTHMGNFPVMQDLKKALDGATTVFVMTDHSEYKNLSDGDVDLLRGRLLIDGRNILPPSSFDDDKTRLVQVGRPFQGQ